jgi:tetratricopeptide (TPR) repeat protein
VSLRGAEARTKPPAPKRSLRWMIPVGAIFVGGAALAFVPDVGPFGAYFLLDQVRAGQYEEELAESAKKARARLLPDTAADARAAAAEIERSRAASPRVRGLRSLAAYVAATRELRFGADPELSARAKVLLDEFEGQEGIGYLDLARAGRAATEGQFQRARALLQKTPNDVDALFLSGEVELKAQDAQAAVAVWEKLKARAPSARSEYGLARARFAAGDKQGAELAAQAALAQNPAHVGAKILLAKLGTGAGKEAFAMSLLEQVARDTEGASNHERVAANTQLGDIHLARSRISKAEAAYTEALKIDPKAARALVGVGEALFRAGRYSEAQARFEAGAQADPEDLFAKVGIAKSKLMLERVEDANDLLKALRAAQPNSVLVAYWYGRVLEAIGNRNEAEKVYAAAIEKTQADRMLVDTYIALALLQNQQGRAEAAQKTLAQAREKLPPSVAIYKALGDVAISQSRYADAVSDLNKALELDSEDLGARFRLGVAYRRDGKVDLAMRAFEQVAQADPDYPGLALERGMLYEATGRAEEALRAYENARTKAPNDTDLMLRVGCGYAVAGRSKEAEELLRKVLSSRPTSAETHYCLGRALFADSSRLADALRLFDRAAELDPHRAEYQLYVGWASRESGNLPKATRALDQAIALDQGLGDAYWQRGILRQQLGAVKDAVADLLRALELRPQRQEVHAALADAYFDLGREAQALSEWKLAVAAQPDNSTWHFRYGKLLAANHMNELARAELSKALELHEKGPAGERWLPWEAHLLLARAIGQKPEAVNHWNEFLRLGPLDSPYRAEAKAALDQLGVH